MTTNSARATSNQDSAIRLAWAACSVHRRHASSSCGTVRLGDGHRWNCRDGGGSLRAIDQARPSSVIAQLLSFAQERCTTLSLRTQQNVARSSAPRHRSATRPIVLTNSFRPLAPVVPSFPSSSMPHLATPPTVTDTSFPETPLVYRNHEPRRRRVFSSPTRTLFPCAKPCCSSASVTPCTRTANVLCSHVPSPAAQRVCAASPCRLPLPCALRGRYQDVKPTRTALTRHSWPPTIPPHSLDLGLRSKP